MRRLAVLGGAPAVEREIPINRPTLPALEEVRGPLERILASGQITSGRYAAELEEQVQDYCKVPHAVAVASCTSGLMLALKALARDRPQVLLPSFTFPATAHVVEWNHRELCLADCDDDSLNLSVESAAALADERVGAILAVPIFGNPVQGARLQRLAARHGVPLIYDAAHALGAREQGRPITDFADAAVFSLAPTKLVPAGEGGIVATRDPDLARWLRVGRNYGNPGNYDCEFAGLNARMSEFHAVMALHGLARLEAAIQQRGEIVARYRRLLHDVPGVGFQEIRAGDRSTLNYFAIRVRQQEFGLHVEELRRALKAEGIACRRYFYPPIHRQRIYATAAARNGRLPVTERVAEEVLCLPLYTHMPMAEVEVVAGVIREIHAQATDVGMALRSTDRPVVGVAP